MNKRFTVSATYREVVLIDGLAEYFKTKATTHEEQQRLEAAIYAIQCNLWAQQEYDVVSLIHLLLTKAFPELAEAKGIFTEVAREGVPRGAGLALRTRPASERRR